MREKERSCDKVKMKIAVMLFERLFTVRRGVDGNASVRCVSLLVFGLVYSCVLRFIIVCLFVYLCYGETHSILLLFNSIVRAGIGIVGGAFSGVGVFVVWKIC